MRITRRRLDSERGAVLLHVAIGILVMIGLLTFVVDWGVMWVGAKPGAELRRCRSAGRRRLDGVRCEWLDGSDRDWTGAASRAADSR